MCRYETKFDDGDFYLETDDGWLEVGAEATLLELLGETYALEYDDRQQAVSWLETDEDGVLTFDVRETLSEQTFTEDFVAQIADCDPDATTDEGVPVRTAVFADMMRSIWDAKGNLEA
ncbi:hypothetical protein [Natronobacterium texcoconense]|uniref:Uncharacterized protein n=1 Tax=Natronobacterium texcoconense TaxID=1095778 RepID=A0A1H1FV99_NATTX|nr:hypothetical protein [Natronobacterium texcoconense]SDR04658.1 hypothetical protein SAMN04489842_2124 [Natronobacterium texcoconense]